MKDVAKKAKVALQHRTEPKPVSPADFLSTSITPLNLACYNRVYGGLQKGSIYRIIGKSGTTKTFLTRSILTEAANNRAYHNYLLRHNDIERGARMDTGKFFGSKLEPRLDTCRSVSLAAWYEEILALLERNQSFIEVTDSLDALEAVEITKMSDGKAKMHAQYMRKLMAGLERTGSILLLVQHAKDNIGEGWNPLYTTGGESPEYYSSLDIWLGKREAIKKTYKGTEYQVGRWYEAHVIKNRISGQDRKIRFPLLVDYGIDDVGACIEYLVSCLHWKSKDGIVDAPEFLFQGSRTKLIVKIEEERLLTELRQLAGKVWKDINAALATKRPPRYQ